MAERFASVSEDELCEKCTIKLLNSVFAWYHELSKPRVCIICLSLRLRQITQTRSFDKSWYHAQPHSIIVYLMTGPEGNSEFVSRESQCFPTRCEENKTPSLKTGLTKKVLKKSHLLLHYLISFFLLLLTFFFQRLEWFQDLLEWFGAKLWHGFI